MATAPSSAQRETFFETSLADADPEIFGAIRSELGRGAAPGGAPRPLDRGWSGEKSFPAVPGMGTADPAPIHKDIDHYRHKEGKRTRKEAAHG